MTSTAQPQLPPNRTQLSDPCPGCGHVSEWWPDCEHCEYHNLLTGRSHYCGADSCYCRNLRSFMKRSVLDVFAARFKADREEGQ